MPHPRSCGPDPAEWDEVGCLTLLWSPRAGSRRVPQVVQGQAGNTGQSMPHQAQAAGAPAGSPHLRWDRREAQVQELLQGLLLHLGVGLRDGHGGLAHPLEVRLLRECLPLLCSWLCGRPACGQAPSQLREAASSHNTQKIYLFSCCLPLQVRRGEVQGGGRSWRQGAGMRCWASLSKGSTAKGRPDSKRSTPKVKCWSWIAGQA